MRNFDPRGLSPGVAADRELVLAQIRGQLLALETIRAWEKNPDIYSSGVTNAIFVIMSRNFAPPAERLKVGDRARAADSAGVPIGAREPEESAAHLHRGGAGAAAGNRRASSRTTCRRPSRQVTDPALLAEFQKTNQAVIDALKAYQACLKNDLLPRSNGDFRIGAENYRKKLLYDEMVDTPLDRLLEIGYEDLRRNQAGVRARGGADRPEAHAATDSCRSSKTTIRRRTSCWIRSATCWAGCASFIETHHIVTIPSPVPPIVEETPPFMRALTTASMDTPGPYEKVAKEAFFNVTLPEATWPPKQVEEYLEGFNRGTIISTAVHEVYPGPLHAVPVAAAGADQGAQADRVQLQRRGLGALQRADDARRRLRQRRPQAAPGPVAGRAAARMRASSPGSRCTPAR